MPDSSSQKPDLPTGIALTGLDPTFRNNPHAILDRLRIEAPRHYDPALNVVYVTPYADVKAVLADKNLSRDPRKAPEGSIVRLRAPKAIVSGEHPPNMMWMDDPEHKRQRGLVAKAFTLRAVEALRPKIEQIVEEHLAKLDGVKAFDAVADFSWRVPICVIAELLGFPLEEVPPFFQWSLDMGLTLNPFCTPEEEERLAKAEKNLSDYLNIKIPERRAAPGEDLLSRLVLAEDNGERLSDGEIVSLVVLVILAGNITTTDLIGNGIVHLLHHPDQLQLLKENPELWRSATEEILRYDPPVGATMRHALFTGEVMGCPVRPGTAFAASLMGANHDPEVFECPHQLKVDRTPNDHVAFGGGAHYCMGAPLAKLEGEIALSRFFERFPSVRLAEEFPPRKAAPTFNGYDRIPLVID